MLKEVEKFVKKLDGKSVAVGFGAALAAVFAYNWFKK